MPRPAAARPLIVALLVTATACAATPSSDETRGGDPLPLPSAANESARAPEAQTTEEGTPNPSGDLGVADDDEHVGMSDVATPSADPADDVDRFLALAPADDEDDLTNGAVFEDGPDLSGAPVTDLDVAPNETLASKPLLKAGLHPRASDALRTVGVSASRIVQTVGGAPKSGGTHLADGTVNGHAYTTATDISVRDLSTTDIRRLLTRLRNAGFAAWYRNPGFDGWPSGAGFVKHIHAVYAGAKMKAALRAQISDYLVGKNGLASHTRYTFMAPSETSKRVVRDLYARYVLGQGAPRCVTGGTYCGGDKLKGDTRTLYRCLSSGAGAVVRTCGNGCVVAPPGRDDYCR